MENIEDTAEDPIGENESSFILNHLAMIATIVGFIILLAILYYRPITAAVQTMTDAGVPAERLALLLTLPIIAFLIVACRNLVGLKTFGIFTPALLAVAFLQTGLLVGMLLFLTLLAVGSGVRLIFEEYPLLALPRMGVILAAVAFTVFGLIYIGARTGINFLVDATVLPLVILTMVIERFISVQMEETAKEAVKLMFYTLLVAVIVYIAISTGLVQQWIGQFPELAVIATFGIILVGRWTGLRLTEYLRFKSVHEHAEI